MSHLCQVSVALYTLPQNKRNFNFHIFHGYPRPGSVTPGHVHQGKCPWSNVQMKFGPKFTDLHSSPKEKQLQKNCVSFGEKYKCKKVSTLIVRPLLKNFVSLCTIEQEATSLCHI